MLESTVENRLISRVRAAGGMTIKNIPTVAGVPDRLVILPGNVIRFVELKSPTGRLRPAQVAWHKKAAKRGVDVPVLSTRAEVDDWIESVTRGPTDPPVIQGQQLFDQHGNWVGVVHKTNAHSFYGDIIGWRRSWEDEGYGSAS